MLSNGLFSNIKDIIKKCRNFGVKNIFITGLYGENNI